MHHRCIAALGVPASTCLAAPSTSTSTAAGFFTIVLGYPLATRRAGGLYISHPLLWTWLYALKIPSPGQLFTLLWGLVTLPSKMLPSLVHV